MTTKRHAPRQDGTVWIVNHYAGHPRRSTSGSRHHSLARGLLARGWNVTIIAADTAHPSGRRFPTPHVVEVVDGVTYRWVRTPPYPRGGTFTRMGNMLWFATALLSWTTIRGLPRPDVIVGSTVHPFAAWSASRLARRLGVPFVFEIRDLWPETLIQIGNLSRTHPLVRVLARIERTLVHDATTIVTTMPRAYVYLGRLGVPASKVVWISNGVEVDRFLESDPPERKEHHLLYFGSLGAANGMNIVIEAFAAAVRSGAPLRLSVVGDGPERRILEQQTVALNIGDAVDFMGAVSRERIPALAAEADAFIACTLPLPLYEYGISLNKLFEYLAGARPIVFGGATSGNPVAEAPGVFVVEPTAAAMSAAIEQVARADARLRRTWGRANRDYARNHFSYDVLAARLAEELRAAVDHR